MNTQKTTDATPSDRSAHFGFRHVGEEAKEGMVQAVFDRVAVRYDLMNDVMSAGMHHLWKDRLIDALRPAPDMHLIDVAGGTGDIAARFLARGGGAVTVADLNEEMLRVGRARAIDCGNASAPITWLHANAEAMPCDAASFDAYTVSFGIRNVTHLDRALSEAYRVLRRGGHFLCLEFSTPPAAWLQRLYDSYSFRVIPELGDLLTGDREAYQYLVESIRQFPDADAFAEMIRSAGFGNVSYQRLSGGIVAIHSGWKV